MTEEMVTSDVRRLTTLAGGPLGDLAFGVAAVGAATILLVDDGTGGAVAVILLAAMCCCATLARYRPRTAVLLACPLLVASDLVDGRAQSAGQAIMLIVVFPLVYRLATRSTTGWALGGTAAIIVCWQATAIWRSGADALNPSMFYAAIGPCAVGLVVAARDRSRAQLTVKAEELRQAQQQFSAESVRHERTRISRELHDIVAHCVSVIVVQAGAGERLATREPVLAAEVFDHISDSARQASDDLARLVTLLEPVDRGASRSIAELVDSARANGLPVGYLPDGNVDKLAQPPGDVAYAVVQEAITNACKHAPGAPIEVRVRCGARSVDISVTNGPARDSESILAGTGGRHGISGLRERVDERGGAFAAQPTQDGGWRVHAHLPTGP